MRNLQTVARECMEELYSIGIPFGRIVDFSVNTRAVKRWGQCRKNADGYHININIELLREDNDISGLKNTIIHEILHTCSGCMNHGYNWNYWANLVQKELGYDIKRVNSDEEKGLSKENIQKRNEMIRNQKKSRIKYKATCQGCGQTGYYQRWTPFLENPSDYKCRKCGGRFKVEGVNGNVVLGIRKVA